MAYEAGSRVEDSDMHEDHVLSEWQKSVFQFEYVHNELDAWAPTAEFIAQNAGVDEEKVMMYIAETLKVKHPVHDTVMVFPPNQKPYLLRDTTQEFYRVSPS